MASFPRQMEKLMRMEELKARTEEVAEKDKEVAEKERLLALKERLLAEREQLLAAREQQMEARAVISDSDQIVQPESKMEAVIANPKPPTPSLCRTTSDPELPILRGARRQPERNRVRGSLLYLCPMLS